MTTARKTSFFSDIVKPALIGIFCAIIIGLFVPDFVLNSFKGAGGLQQALNIAWDNMIHRLAGIFNEHVHDPVAWAVPLFGAILGTFLRFVSNE